MINLLALVCFIGGAVAFGRFFVLAPKLSSERIGEPSRLQRVFPWLPGQFTPQGEKLYKQMNLLLLVGWALLVAGMLLS